MLLLPKARPGALGNPDLMGSISRFTALWAEVFASAHWPLSPMLCQRLLGRETRFGGRALPGKSRLQPFHLGGDRAGIMPAFHRHYTVRSELADSGQVLTADDFGLGYGKRIGRQAAVVADHCRPPMFSCRMV